MENQFTRTELLLGPEAMERLSRSRVIVFGVGGVGGYVVEVLARSGVGMLALVDNDRVAPSNLNRQIIALHSTLGRLKVDVLEERIHDINPQCEVRKFPMFYLPENADAIQLEPRYIAPFLAVPVLMLLTIFTFATSGKKKRR